MKLSRIEKIIKKNSWDKLNYVQSDGQHLYWNDCQTFIKFKDQNLPLGFYHYKLLFRILTLFCECGCHSSALVFARNVLQIVFKYIYTL